MSTRWLLPLASAAILAGLVCAATDKGVNGFQQDAQLRAMADELARSRTLQLNKLDKPYFIEYTTDDMEEVMVAASLGGLTRSTRFHLRRPGVIVRVGDYGFDNTNSIYSANPNFGLFPLDDDYQAMRTSLWRITDALYKAATDEITRKRNALREISEPDKTADLAPAKAIRMIETIAKVEVSQAAWQSALRNASERFISHPGVLTSNIRVQAISSTYRLVNTEGTVLRVPRGLDEVEIRASGRAADGQRVWNHQFLATLDPAQLPQAEQLGKMADAVGADTEALVKAPLAEDYSGPVIFEQEAAAEMMAQVLTDSVTLRRRPVAPPGANNAALQILDSVWASRISSKVASEWLTVFDNPLEKAYRGVPLAGYYAVDDEGVPAQRVLLIEKGTFKGFLLSRVPVRNFSGSNGHGRLPGPFGSEAAVFGNLFIETSQPVPEAQLRKRLIERVKSAGLKYGLIVKRLDFPSTASLGELQSTARQLQKSGFVRTVSQPLLAYRVFPDAHEELVRGLRFREFSAKDLRDIAAASDRPYVLNYVNTGSSWNVADLRTEATTSSVICPSLLFESVELTRAENEAGAPPVVPPPSLVAGR